MKQDEFNSLRKRILEDAEQIAKSKGADYTKSNIDVLTNFKEGKSLGLRPTQVCGMFMKKHMDAIYNYIQSNGQSESEPIEERIKDAINYLLLFAGLVVEGESEE